MWKVIKYMCSASGKLSQLFLLNFIYLILIFANSCSICLTFIRKFHAVSSTKLCPRKLHAGKIVRAASCAKFHWQKAIHAVSICNISSSFITHVTSTRIVAESCYEPHGLGAANIIGGR